MLSAARLTVKDGNKETRGVADKCVAMRSFFFLIRWSSKTFADELSLPEMSFQLTNLIPVLTGPNYQEWTASMCSYLMSQGQWKCVKKDAVSPETGKDGDTSALDSWNETPECALGNILLRLHHTITYQFTDQTDPSILWVKLLEKYGVPGLSKNYVDFKTIMDLKFHNNSDPSPTFDQMAALFLHLKQNGLEIPKKLAVMIILSKMPPIYETMVQMCVLAQDGSEEQDPDKIMQRFRSAYDTGNRTGGSINRSTPIS
jgi:hypothetical protein